MKLQELKKKVHLVRKQVRDGRDDVLGFVVTEERNGYAVWVILDNFDIEFGEPLSWSGQGHSANVTANQLASGKLGISRSKR